MGICFADICGLERANFRNLMLKIIGGFELNLEDLPYMVGLGKRYLQHSEIPWST